MEAISIPTLHKLLEFLSLYNSKRADCETTKQTLEIFDMLYNDFIFEKKTLTIPILTQILLCGRKLSYDLSKLMLLLEKKYPFSQHLTFENYRDGLNLMNQISLLKYPTSKSEEFCLTQKLSKFIQDQDFINNWIKKTYDQLLSFKDIDLLLSILWRLNINSNRFLPPLLSFFVQNIDSCDNNTFLDIVSQLFSMNKLIQPNIYSLSMKKIDALLELPDTSISHLLTLIDSLLERNNDISRTISPESEIIKRIDSYIEKNFEKISVYIASKLILIYMNLNFNSKLIRKSFELAEKNLETMKYEECVKFLKAVSIFGYTDNKVFLQNLVRRIFSTYSDKSEFELGFFALYTFTLEYEEIVKEIEGWEETYKKMMDSYKNKLPIYGDIDFRKNQEKKEIYWMLRAMNLEVYTKSIPELLFFFDFLIPDSDLLFKLQHAEENIDEVAQKYDSLRKTEVPKNDMTNKEIIPEKCILFEYLHPNMIGKGKSGAKYLRGFQLEIGKLTKRLGIKLVRITKTHYQNLMKKKNQKDGILCLIKEIKLNYHEYKKLEKE